LRTLEAVGGIAALTGASENLLRRAGLDDPTVRALKSPDLALLESDTEWLAQTGHDLITWDSERYPALLRQLSSPPAALFTDGDAETLWQPQLAIVGSRNPTAGGRENARDFSAAIVHCGLTVTSGLASGVDACAHAAAIAAGGRTIAVAGTGLDQVYPPENRALAGDIRDRGVLVSELPPGSKPRRSHFPSRNRIISGLSLGVLVIEAGVNSGSLITAHLAAEQGREVFALPGSIHNPMSKGCHRLIREGAKLVETVTDILQDLAPLAGQLAASLGEGCLIGLEKQHGAPNFGGDHDYLKLWECLGHDPLTVDTIIRQSGLTAKAVSAMLQVLELRGQVEAHPGGSFSRKK